MDASADEASKNRLSTSELLLEEQKFSPTATNLVQYRSGIGSRTSVIPIGQSQLSPSEI